MDQNEYKTMVEDAKAKLTEINAAAETANTKVTEASAKLEELKLNASENQKLQASIKALHDSLNSLSQNAEAKKKEIDVKAEEIINFYSGQYIPIRDNILSPATGLQAMLSDSEKKNSSIANIDEQAKIHLEGLKTSIDQYNIALKSLTDTQNNINTFFENAQKTANDQLNNINTVKADVDRLLKDIKDTDIASGDLKTKIEELHKDSQETNKNIQGLKGEADNIKTKINTIYEQATNDMQGGAFGNHVNFLIQDLGKWGNKIQNWTLYLMLTIIGLFAFQVGLNKWELPSLNGAFYLRFTFTTPIIFYLAFCTRQYSLIRTSLDRYTFKKIMALSVEPHTEILKTNFPTKEQERLKFTSDVLEKIYEIPFYDEAMKMKDKIYQNEIKYGVHKNTKFTIAQPSSGTTAKQPKGEAI